MQITQYGTARASFDLTDFGSKERFTALLREAGLTENKEYDSRGFEWHGLGEDVVVHTYNHPISGAHSTDGRPVEEGYASYIHILGTRRRVDEVYELVEEAATHIKDGSKTEWIV